MMRKIDESQIDTSLSLMNLHITALQKRQANKTEEIISKALLLKFGVHDAMKVADNIAAATYGDEPNRTYYYFNLTKDGLGDPMYPKNRFHPDHYIAMIEWVDPLIKESKGTYTFHADLRYHV